MITGQSGPQYIPPPAISIDDKFLYEPVKPVGTDQADLDEARSIGQGMINMARKLEGCMCLAANQIGYDKRINIMANGRGGYDVYLNATVEPVTQAQSAEGVSIFVGADPKEYFVKSYSFPKKKVRLKAVPKVKVSAFSLTTNDREEFEAEGDLAVGWQYIIAYFNGVNKADVVEADVLTIKRTEKKLGPNDRCPKCGKKMKKCGCCARCNQPAGKCLCGASSGVQIPESAMFQYQKDAIAQLQNTVQK